MNLKLTIASIVCMAVVAVTATGCLPNNEPDDPIAAQREQLQRAQQESPTQGGTISTTPQPVEEVTSDWPDADLELFPIAELDQPIALATRSGSSDLWIAQRPGQIVRIERTVSKRGEKLRVSDQLVLDLSEEISTNGEGGLLNLAFSTDGRRLFVMFTQTDGAVMVSSFEMDSRNRADTETRVDLIRVPQPKTNHNGGGLAIGPDGFLYIGLGDGGGSGDPDANGQDTSTLLGSVLRIDPDSTEDQAYQIPAGNPFSDDSAGTPEIFLWGVRNGWRLSFDPATGDLWLADVGQENLEEVNWMRAGDGGGNGANLGWNEMEGDIPYADGQPPTGHVAPFFVYPHEDGRCSITGGERYRGEAIEALQGVYIFGDFCTGEIFGLKPTQEGPEFSPLRIAAQRSSLVSFGHDDAGELYVIELTGMVSRIQLKPIEEEDE